MRNKGDNGNGSRGRVVPDLFQDSDRFSGGVVQVHYKGVRGVARQFFLERIRRRRLNRDVTQVTGGLLNFCKEEDVVNYGQNFCRHVRSFYLPVAATGQEFPRYPAFPAASFSIQPVAR